MVDGVEESGFWLPSEFMDDLYGDELISSKEKKKNHVEEVGFGSEFCFPKEFPYESNSDEKSWVMSTSPQSTLSRLGSFSGRGSSNGSPNGVNSPPTMTSPSSHAVEELVHQAVGQVAKLKLNAGSIHPKAHVGTLKTLQQVQRERSGGVWYGTHQHQQVAPNRKMTTNQGQASWIGPHRIITRSDLAIGSNNGGVKRPCAGTGVFLPRRYDNDDKIYNRGGYNSESHRKTALISDRDVRAAPNKRICNINDNATIRWQPQLQSQIDKMAFVANYEMLMARRNALLLQQQRRKMLVEESSLRSRGIYLPQEWTY